MLRVLPWLLLVLFPIVVVAQTADDLTARYGYPDAEKFSVRPEITMTTKYGDGQAACEMLIEPRNSGQGQSTKEPSMVTAVVSEIIDELIPRWQRGILLDHSIESLGASEHQVFEYQNVTIIRNFIRYLPANQDETTADIVRKDRVCRSSTVSQEFVPSIQLTADDLHARYGDSVAQRFKIRPDITLTANCGQDQSACEISIGRTRSIIPRDEPTKYMRPEVMTEIIDEVLPEADRGKLLLGVVTKSGCNDLETRDYENVTIHRFRHRCILPNPEIEGTATFTRKSAVCAATRAIAPPS